MDELSAAPCSLIALTLGDEAKKPPQHSQKICLISVSGGATIFKFDILPSQACCTKFKMCRTRHEKIPRMFNKQAEVQRKGENTIVAKQIKRVSRRVSPHFAAVEFNFGGSSEYRAQFPST